MAKWSDEKVADLTRKLADTAINYKQRCEELEAKLAKAVAFIEDLTGHEWPIDVQAKRILAAIREGKE